MRKKGGTSVLLRLAHRFGAGEDVVLSVTARVALADVFCAAHLAAPVSVEELSLSGNQPIAKMLARKKKWRHKVGGSEGAGKHEAKLQRAKPRGPSKIVQLAPLQIRTFLLHY